MYENAIEVLKILKEHSYEAYIVGDNGTDSDTKEGKASEGHIVCALTAITRFLEPNKKENVILMYGESITKYFDSKNKQSIIDKFSGEHEIIVDNAVYNINVEIPVRSAPAVQCK